MLYVDKLHIETLFAMSAVIFPSHQHHVSYVASM